MKKTLYTSLILCAAQYSVYAQTPATPPPVPPAPPAAVQVQTPTTIKFDVTEHEFGNIKEGESVSYTFKFTNTGTAPLELENVQASCGCTTPNWSKGPYAPGASGEITATYNSMGKGTGPFSKTITVYSNGGMVQLYIRGTAVGTPTNSDAPGTVSPVAPASAAPVHMTAPAATVTPATETAVPAKTKTPGKSSKTTKTKNKTAN